MRRDIAAHIKDVAVVRIIVRCWAHTSDGCTAAAEQDQQKRWRAPSMRWRSGAWRFDDVVLRTYDASAFDSDDDEGDAERVQGSTPSITKRNQYDIDWDDIDGAQRPAVEAARLLHTARLLISRHVTLVADAVAKERNGAAGACWKFEGRRSEQTLPRASCDSGEVRAGACGVAEGTP